MTALVFLLIAVVISGVGSLILVLRTRRPTSVESGIDAFQREMQALAPPHRSTSRSRRRSTTTDADVPPGLEPDEADGA